MKYHLTGKKFGKLTAIRMVGNTSSHAVVWECQCDCGVITYATASSLVTGHKKSCGCLKHSPHAEDLKGQRFGYLVVTKRVGTSKNRRALWRCKCDCGKSTTVPSIDLKSGNTKSCGCLGRAYAKRNILKGEVK